jgi:methylphosphotriester-DNA--protein-cysteine methyltransferase
MSKFDRERVQYLTEELRHRASMSAFRPATKAEIEEAAKMLESALALHDEHKKLLRELAELRAHPKVAHRLHQAAEHLKLKAELERLKAAHATLLSREAKEEALAAAFNSGYCFHANNDSVESAELSAKARRLLDLDPEDA